MLLASPQSALHDGILFSMREYLMLNSFEFLVASQRIHDLSADNGTLNESRIGYGSRKNLWPEKDREGEASRGQRGIKSHCVADRTKTREGVDWALWLP